MKKGLCFVLLLCLALALCACGGSDTNVVGTWAGEADITDQVAASYDAYYPGCGAYFSDVKADFTLVLKEDGTFSISKDGTPAQEQMQKCMEQYLLDAFAEEYGAALSKEELLEAGVDVEATAAQLVDVFALGFNGQPITGNYKVDGDKITMGSVTGTVSGDTITLMVSTFGEMHFTRK